MSQDHTELIARLRSIQSPHCQHAADAIEALVVERDAAVAERRSSETIQSRSIEELVTENTRLHILLEREKIPATLSYLKAIKAERDAAMPDAERYRWLREQWAPSISKRPRLAIDTTIVSAREAVTPMDIDAAIDAAIQEGKT